MKAICAKFCVFVIAYAFVHFVQKANTVCLNTKCKTSDDCPTGSCCRDSNGNVLVSSESWLEEPIGQEGVCVTGFASESEKCGGSCQCATNYTCYRPVSGACCPPYLCYDSEYVRQQEEYWRNCSLDPNCFFPP